MIVRNPAQTPKTHPMRYSIFLTQLMPKIQSLFSDIILWKIILKNPSKHDGRKKSALTPKTHPNWYGIFLNQQMLKSEYFFVDIILWKIIVNRRRTVAVGKPAPTPKIHP